MSNIIGYKDTPVERRQNWLTMQMLKGSIELFSTKPGEQEKKIVKQDKRIYHNFLSDYVKH